LSLVAVKTIVEMRSVSRTGVSDSRVSCICSLGCVEHCLEENKK